MKFTPFALLSLLSACALTPPADHSKMSPEQIKESVKDRGASANCVKANSPWGMGVTVQITVDKDSVKNGSVSVDQECKITFSNEPTPKK